MKKKLLIRNMHIHFEDSIFQANPYSFGFLLKSLSVKTTNAQWQTEFIDRTEEQTHGRPIYKNAKLEDFAFYWESNETVLITKMEEDKTIEETLQKVSSNIPKKNYILKPLNITLFFIQSGISADYTKPKYTAKVAIENLAFKMHKTQFDNLVEISKVVEKYQRMQHSL